MNRCTVLTGMIAAVCAGCVSQQQFDFLQWQHTQLQAEHRKLAAGPATRPADQTALEQSLADCTRARSAALAKVTELQNTQAALRQRLEQARAEAGPAAPDPIKAEEAKRLRVAWEALERERDHLRTQVAAKHEETEFLQNRIERLERELARARPATAPAKSGPDEPRANPPSAPSAAGAP